MQDKAKEGVHKKTLEYEDFIKYSPEIVKYVSQKEIELIKRYDKILKGLRNRNMTAKEIRNFYYDPDTKKYDYTIKTIYKHLENLENANLVKTSGYRNTKGHRTPEKLYSLTANIFYPDPEEEESEHVSKVIKHYSDIFNTIMAGLLESPKADENAFLNFFEKLHDFKTQSVLRILEKAKTDDSIARALTKIDSQILNKVTESISFLVFFIAHPKIMEELKSFFVKI
ncbi:MAG: hypothetical protein ACFFBD_20855 [Candidatus Hodarchaeota archaeon]